MMVRLGALAWRALRHYPRRIVLTLVGSALGVGLMVAILALAAMARAGVEARLEELYGGIDLVVGAANGQASFNAADLAEIEALAGVRDVGVAYAPFAGDRFEVEQATRYFGVSDHPATLRLFQLPRPLGAGEVFVSELLAAELGITEGQEVTLPFPDQPRTYRVGAIVSPPLRAGAPKTAYFSLQALQEATGRPGAITGFYLRLTDPALKQQIAWAIEKSLTSRYPTLAQDLIIDLAFEADEARRTVGGLKNLGVLTGSLALLVSTFLVVGVNQFSLRERLRELALLRAIGATQRQARRTLLVEVLLLGGLGALVGAGVGLLLALAFGRFVSAALGVPFVIALPPVTELAVVTALGWGLQLVAVWLPVRRASNVPPVQAAAESEADEGVAPRRGWLPFVALLGAVALQVIGRATAAETPQLLLATISGLLAVVACFTLAWPLLRLGALVLRRFVLKRGRTLLIALRNVEGLQRQGRWTTVLLGSAVAVAVVAFTLVRTTEEQRLQALRAQFPTPLVVATQLDTVAYEAGPEIAQLPGVAQAAVIGWSVGADWANASEYAVDPKFQQFWTLNGEIRLPIVPVDLRGLADLGLVPPETLSEKPTAVITNDLARQTGLQVGGPS